MSQLELPEGTGRPRPVGSDERAVAGARAALVDSWEVIKKSFAFALAAGDHEAGWLDRISKAAKRVRELTEQDPDVALYMLLQAAATDTENYSASHAIFCAVIAHLCAAHLELPEAEAEALRNASLTMNVGMAQMQDAMAEQAEPLSHDQRLLVKEHPAKGARLLQAAGVGDPLWLEIVRRHHQPVEEGEPCDVLTPPQRLAQLLQRVDVFTAKLSKRRTRSGSTAIVAARDACLDKSGLPDAVGATLLRVLGLYPPGSFVRMVSGEVAVVIRRGDKAHTPLVACLRREDGGLISRPIARDSSHRRHAIQCSLSANEAKVRVDHQRTVGALR